RGPRPFVALPRFAVRRTWHRTVSSDRRVRGTRRKIALMRLFHHRRGSGAPLLLVQGMGGTHLAWGEPFVTALERDFEIVVYDHRGVGRSPRVDEPFTVRDLAEDARELLDELGWRTAHVVGISMGGMIAQELVIAHPERVSTLTLGCTYAGGPSSRST